MRWRRRRFKRMRKKARLAKGVREVRVFSKYEINTEVLKDALETGAFV